MDQSSLSEFVKDVGGSSHLRIEQDFGDGFVRLQTSEAERRQAIQDIRSTEDVVLELLRNARDAHASHIFVALGRDETTRRIVVLDNGCGIPQALHKRIFEPRVTSKLDTSHLDRWGIHGRGMALYSIYANAQEASVVASAPDKGTSLTVLCNLEELSEKTDQSTFPTFEITSEGIVSVRGPKNIVRTACEFAIDARSSCSVFIGSTTEIAAALYEYGAATLSTIDRVFCTESDKLPLCKRLAAAADPDSFAKIAATLGLDLSTRSARRILDGQIESPLSLIERVHITKPQKPSTTTRSSRKNARFNGHILSLTKSDREQFLDQIMDAYRILAERYYLNEGVTPTLRITPDTLHVAIPLVQDE